METDLLRRASSSEMFCLPFDVVANKIIREWYQLYG